MTKNLNYLVSLCWYFSLPSGVAKLLSGLTHCKRLGQSFQLSISTRHSRELENPFLKFNARERKQSMRGIIATKEQARMRLRNLTLRWVEIEKTDAPLLKRRA